MLAKNGSQRTLLNRITAVQDDAIFAGDAGAEVAVSLSIQKEIDRSTADFQDPGKGPTLHRIEVGALLGRLTHEDGEVVGQIHESIGLVRVQGRCEDHTTASMLVWV